MKHVAILASAVAVLFAAPASAAQIDLATLLGGTYDVQDQEAVAGDFFNNTYRASVAITAKFTDLYVVGDEYNVYKNGTLLSFAGVPVGSNTAFFTSDPSAAYNSGNYARGLVSLAAGDVLSFRIATIPAGYTDATIAVTALAAVPEPATWAMMIGGFGLVGGALRRRNAAVRTRVSFV